MNPNDWWGPVIRPYDGTPLTPGEWRDALERGQDRNDLAQECLRHPMTS